MTCPTCNYNHIPKGTKYCQSCGYAFIEIPETPGAIDWYFNDKRRKYQHPSPTRQSDTLTNRWAIASLVVGVLSVFLYEFSLFPLMAIISGIVALYQIDKTKESGKWLAWIGLGLGLLYLFMNIVYLPTPDSYQ